MEKNPRATIIGGLHPGRTAKVRKSFLEPLKTVLQCPTSSMCMSMLHVYVHFACLCHFSCCMSMSMLHAHAAGPCTVHAAGPFPCCMFMPVLMHHAHADASCPCYAACPCSCSCCMVMPHGAFSCPFCMSLLPAYQL